MPTKFPIILFIIVIIVGCSKNPNTITPSQKVVILQEKSKNTIEDSTYLYLKEADKLIKNNAEILDSLKGENNYLLGLYFRKKEKTDSAAFYFHNATDFVNDTLSHERHLDYFRFAWNAYRDLGQYADCITISDKFKLTLYEEKHTSAYTWAYHWEKTAYLKLGKYEKAARTIETQLERAKRKDTTNIPYVLNVQAQFQYYQLGKKKEGKKILENLLRKPEKLTDNFLEQTHTNYGVFMYYDGNYKKALFHYLKSLEAGKKNTKNKNYNNSMANNYNNIAEVYMDLNDYPKARKYLDSTQLLGVGKLAEHRLNDLLNYELRYAIAQEKDTKKIFDLFKKITTYRDSSYRQKSEKELLALTQSNENEKILLKDKQAAEIAEVKANNIMLFIVAASALLGLIGIIIYQRKRLRFEREALQNQQRLFRSQMNPHFAFNILYTIQNHLKKDAKAASKYLLKFSRLFRLILENSTQNYVQLEKELDALRKYMDLQLLRLPDRFTYRIDLINIEENELVFIPPMLLQPFIENSIEHGFKNIDYTGELCIIVERKNNFIECTIEDNGVGVSNPDKGIKKSTSIQLISDFILKTTKQELSIINKKDIDDTTHGVRINFLTLFKLTEND